MSAPHSIATTIDTTEGWTFTNNDTSNEFPTTTKADEGWGEAPAATTTEGWGTTPAAPSPPLSAVGQPRTNDHASLHWTACYDDYCGVHRQMKDNNYYPRRANGRHRRNHQQCNCENAHPFELAEVIRNRHLNPRRACTDWQKGKRVCPDCRHLVNITNHQQRCTAAPRQTPVMDIPPENPQENEGLPQEAPTGTNEDRQGITQILAFVYTDLTRRTRQLRVQQHALAQANTEQHQLHQAQLGQIADLLTGILEQQRQPQPAPVPTISRPVRIHRTPTRRPRQLPRPDLAGASVWTGGVLSRTWRDRLTGAAAGAAVTLATMWLILISAAAVAVILRA